MYVLLVNLKTVKCILLLFLYLNLFIYFLCRIIKIEKKLQYIFNNVN